MPLDILLWLPQVSEVALSPQVHAMTRVKIRQDSFHVVQANLILVQQCQKCIYNAKAYCCLYARDFMYFMLDHTTKVREPPKTLAHL